MEILGGLLGGPRRSEGSFGTKIFAKFYQILNELKIHPYMSVLKLPLLAALQQKVGELLV
jgi:hypothetical protein